MRVYKEHRGDLHTLFVQPGREHPENSEWIDGERNAIMIPVKFKYGIAETDSQLGNYLVNNGLASSSPIIIASAIQ